MRSALHRLRTPNRGLLRSAMGNAGQPNGNGLAPPHPRTLVSSPVLRAATPPSVPPHAKVLTRDTLSPALLRTSYAVRGPLAILADQLNEERLAAKQRGPGEEEALVARRGWKNVVLTNIGNPQALGQVPITFFRQVLALTSHPPLMDSPLAVQLFPPDAIARARTLIKAFGGSTGAYTHSQGAVHVRRSVARFITERDGAHLPAAEPSNIFVTAGASPAVQLVLEALIAHQHVGILVPVPQYPLYSASISLLGGQLVSYGLVESKDGWKMSPESIRDSVRKARGEGLDVRAVCVINPGNPTGNCLSREDVEKVIDIAKEERLVVLADEVYQTNTYLDSRPFISFRKVLLEKQAADPSYADVELFSFHSVSKGVVGECGQRGGYVECVNVDPDAVAEMYKVASISLCSNTSGQILVDLMVDPPRPGDPSYEQYKEETIGTYESLKRRAIKLVAFFNTLPGVSCAPPEGALYVHPRVAIPAAAAAEAREKGQEPDEFYAMEMLRSTGVCVVPGSGFLQEPGTWHFRSTFLPPEEEFDGFMGRIEKFHRAFMDKYK
ncbi:pyridoxal phosphate-dependent transferase [Hyaloraphidium curvatum]|nr:pyridoxal phosphate-dependent transferase [Hyaloraphidium curvatum]